MAEFGFFLMLLEMNGQMITVPFQAYLLKIAHYNYTF